MKERRIVRRSRPSPHAVGKTDFKRLARSTDRDIEEAIKTDPDTAPLLDEEWFRKAKIVWPERRVPVSLRIDREVLDWFKKQGRGYQSRMRAVLRAYFEAHAAHH